MERGISVWIFSKIVMLIFLFLTLSVVLSYMHLINERISADSAEALTMQIKNTVQSVLIQETLSSQLVVPLPETLPEKGYGAETYEETGKARLYTLHVSTTISSGQQYVSIALGWGAYKTPPKDYSYSAASWLLAPSVDLKFGETGGLVSGSDIYLNSQDHRFFVVRRQGDSVCLLGCDKDKCETISC